MRIGAQSMDFNVQQSTKIKTPEVVDSTVKSSTLNTNLESVKVNSAEESSTSTEKTITSEDLQQAVDTMNELLDSTHKASKFVFHEGLDKYYVRLVDTKTDEVIKEIPPERLLDAFYEMQKLAGMIVDEKI